MKDAGKAFPGVLRIFGPKHDAEEEALRQVRPLLYAAHVPEKYQNSGTPRAAAERKRIRRERLWRHSYRVGITLVLLGIGFMAGYNVRIGITETKRSAEVTQYIPSFREQRESVQRARREYRAAMLVPQPKRKCAMNWSENCLVCEHRSLSGTVKSTMC